MSVRRDPVIYLSPTRPTPLSPPLTLSPLDVSMLSSRLDFLFVYPFPPSSPPPHLSPPTPPPPPPPRPPPPPIPPRTITPLSPPRHYHIPPPLSTSFMCLPHLQQSLRDTLSDYHVLAGRLTVDSYQQQAIRLTDEGVGWITARCDVGLEGVVPPAHLRGDHWDVGGLPAALLTSLPPLASTSTPLLQVQYTTLACGAVCLGVSVYHGVMDAKALFLFLSCWAQQSRGKRFTRPSHDRHTLANMRAAPDTLITHDEYVIVSRGRAAPSSQPSTPTSGSAAPQPLHRSWSMGGGHDLSMSPAAPSSRPRGSETSMRAFHFTKGEIDRMKRAVMEVPSPSSAIMSPLQSPTSLSLPPSVGSAGPSPASLPAVSRTLFTSPLSPTASSPASPRLSSLAYTAPYHPDYISTFDVLSAHFWQLIMRARYPQLVAVLPSPPPPPAHLLASSAVSGFSSPTGSRPTTPTRTSSSTSPFSSLPSTSLRTGGHAQTTGPFPPSGPSPMSVAYAGSGWAPPPLPASISTSAAMAVTTHLAVAFNGRNRLDPPLPDVYCGNATFLSVIPAHLPSLLTSPLPPLTRLIRNRMNQMVGEYLRSALTVLATPLPPSTSIVPSFDCRACDVLVTSFLHSDVYSVDFGSGGPEWVGVMGGGERGRWEGYVALMGGGRAGGVDVVLCLKEEEMRRLVADDRLRGWREVEQGRGLGMLMERMEQLELAGERGMEAV